MKQREFKNNALVKICKESQRVYRDVIKRPDLALRKGVVLSARWDERGSGHYIGSEYIYTVEFTDGEVSDIAASHLVAE